MVLPVSGLVQPGSTGRQDFIVGAFQLVRARGFVLREVSVSIIVSLLEFIGRGWSAIFSIKPNDYGKIRFKRSLRCPVVCSISMSWITRRISRSIFNSI